MNECQRCGSRRIAEHSPLCYHCASGLAASKFSTSGMPADLYDVRLTLKIANDIADLREEQQHAKFDGDQIEHEIKIRKLESMLASLTEV